MSSSHSCSLAVPLDFLFVTSRYWYAFTLTVCLHFHSINSHTVSSAARVYWLSYDNPQQAAACLSWGVVCQFQVIIHCRFFVCCTDSVVSHHRFKLSGLKKAPATTGKVHVVAVLKKMLVCSATLWLTGMHFHVSLLCSEVNTRGLYGCFSTDGEHNSLVMDAKKTWSFQKYFFITKASHEGSLFTVQQRCSVNMEGLSSVVFVWGHLFGARLYKHLFQPLIANVKCEGYEVKVCVAVGLFGYSGYF